jgi:hypothetical protein
MYEPNVSRVLDLLKASDIVLDIGGWARPFNRANYVIDAEPHGTRGDFGKLLAAQGGQQECFTKETWFQRDVCERTPFPFADKVIDFVVCSHTLEDVRDPLWVCSEMIRIGKRGYIEVPSRLAESCRGVEPHQVGWSHHRWLVEIKDNSILFLMKYHMIHSHWRFSLSRTYLRSLPEERKVQWLFWDDSFSYSEKTIHGIENIAVELQRFVQSVRPYPKWLLKADRRLREAQILKVRIAARLERTLRSASG